jgi:hypothetical protein
MVKIIDWSPINKKISEAVGREVECRIGKGFIEDVEAIFDREYSEMEIKSIITDNECCARTSEFRSMYVSELNDGKPFQINFIPNVEFYKVDETIDNGRRISIFPSYEFDIDLDDVKKCLTGEEISLYKFMGGRYGYNPRIKANEMDILKLVYQHDILEGDKLSLKEKEIELVY